MWQTISMLFIDQLKTSDDVYIEQASIDDKKEEETWPPFRQLFKRRRSFCDIEKWVLSTDVHHRSNSWTSSSSQCFKYYGNGIIVNRSWYVDVHERKKVDHDIDIETNRLSSTTLHLAKMTLFVYLFKDKLNLENWNVWIDHQIVTMVFLLKLIRIESFHRSMILIFFQSIVFMNNKCTMGSLYESKKFDWKREKKTFVLKSESIRNKCYVEFSIVVCYFVLCTKTNDESIDA